MTISAHPNLKSVYSDALVLSRDETQSLNMRRAALRLVLAIRMEVGEDRLTEKLAFDQRSCYTALDRVPFSK